MKHIRKPQAVKVQGTLAPDPNAAAKARVLELKEVMDIQSNVCIEKNICQHCGRGDRYGIPLHYLLFYPNGGFKTVCFTCGKKVADETGLRLPPTPLEIEEREDAADLRLIRIARQKKEATHGNI